MKIINTKTGVIFNLPQQDANSLLKSSPDLFAKITKNNKIIQSKPKDNNENSVLNQILDE